VFGGSGGIDEARTMAFTTLVLAQLFNCFNARSDRRSALQHLLTNRWLSAAIALSLCFRLQSYSPVSQQRLRRHAARPPRVRDLPLGGQRRAVGRRSKKLRARLLPR
jgi:hypothetical protein